MLIRVGKFDFLWSRQLRVAADRNKWGRRVLDAVSRRNQG